MDGESKTESQDYVGGGLASPRAENMECSLHSIICVIDRINEQ
jgi:hypothetical protein